MARIPYPDMPQALTTLSVQLNLFLMLVMRKQREDESPLCEMSCLLSSNFQRNCANWPFCRWRMRWGRTYEWVQHVPLALSAGVTHAQIEAIEQGSLLSGLFTGQMQQVLHFVREVYWNRTISGEDFARMR